MCDHGNTREVRIVAPALGQFCATYSPLRLRVGQCILHVGVLPMYVFLAVVPLIERSVVNLLMSVLLTATLGGMHAYGFYAMRGFVGTYRITRFGVVFAARDGATVELEWGDIRRAKVRTGRAVLQGARGTVVIPICAFDLSRSEGKALRRLIRERLRGVGCELR